MSSFDGKGRVVREGSLELFAEMTLSYQTSKRSVGRFVIEFLAAHGAARRRVEHAVAVLSRSIIYPDVEDWTVDGFEFSMDLTAPLGPRGWHVVMARRHFRMPRCQSKNPQAQAAYANVLAGGLGFLLRVPVRVVEVAVLSPIRRS